MAEPKTRATEAPVNDFITAIADPQRRADCKALAKLMQQATGRKARMWGAAIVGFGRYRYEYASGNGGEWPIVAFSPRKNDLTVYVMPGFAGLQDQLARLGRHKTGKSCLYLKSLAEVDQGVLAEIIEQSVAAMAAQRVD